MGVKQRSVLYLCLRWLLVLPAAFLFRALMFAPIVAIEFFWGNIAPRYYIIISIIDGISFVYGGAAFAPSCKRMTQLVLGVGYFLWGNNNRSGLL
jgi:hypothetical protein